MQRSKGFKTLQYIFALLITLFTLGPFVWMFITSISVSEELRQVPLDWIPDTITWQRYLDILISNKNEMAYTFRVAMFNTLQVAGLVTLLALVCGGVAAYAFARLKFKFRQNLIYLFLFTYMIPPVVIVLPLYLMLSSLNMLDSKMSLVLLNATFIIPFVIWIMQSYFGSISKDFEEAAAIDGCNRFQLLWHVIVPIARPGFIATGILAFLMSWEEFFYALLFTSSLDAKTISVAIAEFSGRHLTDYGMTAAGGVVASIPPVVIAIIFQKYLVKGMSGGGVKE
ncbi:carbohydrate ABC transporter permease [Halobacillus sp. BBL2006]|uniref:carbohydrate ABC transporter permease n=1 Tax=Halobacillus sp. BBL2006 TaxID=1543706 RepID=UPI000542DA79|nr:carbohydrate ABC transporter permease [Halobacillus sp. BBL2006]KHE71842.1 ABC transporter permease [Halobacillus sp. BBL2006]